MKRKIILFRLRSMEMGGVQKVLIDILKRLDKDKYDVHLLLNLFQGELLPEIPSEIKMHYLATGKEKLSGNKVIQFQQLLLRRIILSLYSLFPSLLKHKLHFTPDIEIAFMSANLPDLINSPFKKSKKINWFHSDIRFFPKKKAHQLIQLMKKSDTTVFVSKITQKNLEIFAGSPLPNAQYIYNLFDYKNILSMAEEPINNDLFKTEEKVFVSVGRLDYAKGYDVLLNAHTELLREGYQHRIIIIGDGYYYPLLRKKIARENMEKTFILAGQKENPYPYMAAADYYIQSSRYEAYPLAIGEALILNKPIISTDAGGIKEMITHEKTGYIVNFCKDELKQAITTFLSNPGLIENIKNNQRHIDVEKHNQRYYQKIEKLLSSL